MYVGLFDIWKRLLQSLGLIPPENSRYILKDSRPNENRVKPPEFDSSKQIRILLFREHNGQERRLLFDSKAVRKKDPTVASPNGKPPIQIQARQRQESSIEKSFRLNDDQSREYVYELKKPSSDETLLREMIFGSVSISYQGTTLKVHAIRSPSQIMLSLVFPAPSLPPYRTQETDTEESGTWTASVEVNVNKPAEKSDTHLAHSVPVNVPSRLSGQHGDCQDSDTDSLQSLDGYSSLPTTHLSPETPIGGLPRSSSYNSLQRRILRNKATSIELGLPKSEETNSNECSRTNGNRRVKLGLSVVINLTDDSNKPEDKHLSNFIFTHISLIEGHLLGLKDTVIRAYINRKSFLDLMFEGSKKFQKSLCDLYTVPRLQNPEWLTIISSPNHRHLSYIFLEKFADVLRMYDKKETNFFVSTLLTAVLTHHLAWVPSVIPTDSKIQPMQSSHKHTPCWVDLIAKSRPYNPLWVQLSDLYGALGVPLKLSKTIVKGQKKDVVYKFLKILSYFIRCSDICEQDYEKLDGCVDDKELFGAGSLVETETFSSIDRKTTVSESNSSTPVQSYSNVTSCKICLPQTLTIPHSAATTLNSQCDDCASSSSKDTCELTVTPTEERTRQCIECFSSKPEESSLVPIVFETLQTNSRKQPEFNMVNSKTEILAVTKRPALSEQHPNCGQGSVGKIQNALSNMKEGKENSPLINFTFVEGSAGKSHSCLFVESPCRTSSSKCKSVCVEDCKCCDGRDASAKTFDSAKCKSVCSEDCLCCDGRDASAKTLGSAKCKSACLEDCPCCEGHDAKTFGTAVKVKECESIEEGYHSMEEPQSSPGREVVNLSEMLRWYDSWCPEGCEEKSIPGLQRLGEVADTSTHKNFGWSLMAGISDHYLPDFCLQGLCGHLKEEEVKDDLRRCSHIDVLGEPVSEAVCIIADTDKWKVNLLSSNSSMCGGRFEYHESTIIMSALVSEICDSILNMVDLKIPPESCIIYLEDRLQELYTRSQTLADFIRNSKTLLPQSKVASALNVNISDMPLLLSIATTHSPNLSVHSR